ncbi:MAG TPA: hypothetical protein VLV83_23555, partial [Acidobacteriota bacterium]|nr:hypothetical protein [Acidobacteriota bacterium]
MSALTAESVPWESSGLEGHPALVFYFGTEVPQDFFDMAVELTIKFEDLRVVGITPRPEVVLNDLGPPPFPLLGDRHGDLSEKLGLNGPSALFLFDRSGKVRFGKGGLLGREDLRQLIEFTVTGDVDYRPFSPDTEFRGDLGPLKVRNLESELETQLG